MHRGVAGIYEAQIIGYSFSLILLAPYIFKNMSIKFDLQILRELFRFGFPLIFAEISGVVFAITSRYCLKFLASLNEVGTFSLGFKISNTINTFVLGSAMLAITPMIFKKINDADNKKFYAKIMTYLGFGVIIFVMWVSFFSKEIVKLLARNVEYWDAYYVIPLLAFSAIFASMRDISLTGLHITKKTKNVAVIITSMAVINLLLNLFLIPVWSSIGAALATLFAQILFFVTVYFHAQKYYPIPYEMGKMFKMIFLAATLFVCAQLTDGMELISRLLIKHGLILLFPFLLYFLNFYEEVELIKLKHIGIKAIKMDYWRQLFSSKNKT
jgi:O-antigen/teichoic acid export membrane protein